MPEQVAARASATDPRLGGSVCLVTGASRGVGRQTATRLVRGAAHVPGMFRSSEDEARGLAASLRNDAGSIDFVRCDVRDEDRAQRRLLERIPAGRRGDPMEVADVIAYLAAAPTYLTGAIIPIAGAM